jgi:fructosamine-3-kinase
LRALLPWLARAHPPHPRVELSNVSRMQLWRSVEAIVAERIVELVPVGGGSIGQSACATLAGGERLFVKHYPTSPPAAVRCEAQGLRWLAEAQTLRVATVRGVDEAHRVLVLDWIEPGCGAAAGDAELGRGLAELHRTGAETFGAQPDSFIGSLHQSNRPHARWSEFFGAERLMPLVRSAAGAGLFVQTDVANAQRLIERLDQLVGPDEPPARLHGDLWAGNRLCDSAGCSWLIDPAAYGGHREMDLAMMQLFGGFSQTVFDAYAEVFPLAAEAPERVPLYQLYPVLVHMNLFGGHYVDSARRIVRRYV